MFLKPVIQIEKLGKLYSLGASKGTASRTFWALKDVTFSIQRGEVVGIVGKNGAGKSTLVKILSRITAPTSGRAVLRGRASSLLAVGAGFHPDFTGRENVYLNGAVLGMSKNEIDQNFDEIVWFAGVEKFIDTPVKHYSSGMRTRLAFAVAAHLRSEILIMDEVLAVGDTAFQKKCLGKMEGLAGQGRTILFVSHNMGAIIQLCSRAIWLNDGHVNFDGSAEETVTAYLSSQGITGETVFGFSQREDMPGNEHIRLRAVRLKDESGKISAVFDTKNPITVEIEYEITQPIRELRIGFRLIAWDGAIVLSSSDADDELGWSDQRPKGLFVSRCQVPGNFLNSGRYYLSVGSDLAMTKENFSLPRVTAFYVQPIGSDFSFPSRNHKGYLCPRFPWQVEKLEPQLC